VERWVIDELAYAGPEHLRTEFSTYRWLLEPLLDATGFEILGVESRRRLYASYTCRRR
jgi:hypothetical protein